MSSQARSASRKGKGKAVAVSNGSERDPLLPSSSRPHSDIPTYDGLPPQRSVRRRVQSWAYTASIILFSLLLSALLFLALLAWSFRPSQSEMETLQDTAVRYSAPDKISVLEVSDAGILVNVTTFCGIDANKVLGINTFDTPEDQEAAIRAGLRGTGAAWWESVRRWTAGRALENLPSDVMVTIPDPLVIYQSSESPLVSVVVADPVPVPLIRRNDSFSDWLQPVSFTVLAKPIASTGDLWAFVQRSWTEGAAQVTVDIDTAIATFPLDIPWLAPYTTVRKNAMQMRLRVPIPRLPGLPIPGRRLDLSDLVKLQHYTLETSAEALTIAANASVPNFMRPVNATVPFSAPFEILIETDTGAFKMADVVTTPIEIRDVPTISLSIAGRIVANLDFAVRSSPLSLFLQRYLHGLDNPITVRGLSELPSFARGYRPPNWLLSTLPSLQLDLKFPGPQPPPKVIESVAIDKMRISESGGKMRASGVVIANIDLPVAMENVRVDVLAVNPDVLIFDGPAEDSEDEEYPPNAFGHIHPDDFLTSTTTPSDDPEHPHRLVVHAPLEGVPLDVLPGRDGILSAFVRKVIFKGGAQAGIRGTADVKVQLPGVGGTMRLNDLPVTGECWVGRQKAV